MLQDIPTTSSLRAARSSVLETERLTLRPPTLADVKAIARIANDRRIAENTRRLPHPYSADDAVQFVRALSDDSSETAFLIEHSHAPIGIVSLNCGEPAVPELGYWLGVDHWGRGFGTEAARAAIDFLFDDSATDVLCARARVSNPASRNILEKCGFQWRGVELHRFPALGSSAPVDSFRLTRAGWALLKNWAGSAQQA